MGLKTDTVNGESTAKPAAAKSSAAKVPTTATPVRDTEVTELAPTGAEGSTSLEALGVTAVTPIGGEGSDGVEVRDVPPTVTPGVAPSTIEGVPSTPVDVAGLAAAAAADAGGHRDSEPDPADPSTQTVDSGAPVTAIVPLPDGATNVKAEGRVPTLTPDETDGGTTEVVMLITITGLRDGVPWPVPGGRIELPAAEAAQYIRLGYAREP